MKIKITKLRMYKMNDSAVMVRLCFWLVQFVFGTYVGPSLDHLCFWIGQFVSGIGVDPTLDHLCFWMDQIVSASYVNSSFSHLSEFWFDNQLNRILCTCYFNPIACCWGRSFGLIIYESVLK